jgi:hypothetical protein
VVVGYDGGAAGVELYNPAGALVASGGGTNDTVDQVIDNFLIVTNGLHYARVTGAATNYTLLVLQNAAFDLEANDNSAMAQSVSGRATILGAISAPTTLYGVDLREPVDWINTNVIVKIDPTTGKIRRSFDAPETMGGSSASFLNTAFDGTNLWYCDGLDGAVYKLNPTTGAVLGSFYTSILGDGLGYCRGELFLSDAGGEGIEVYSATNFAHLRTLPISTTALDYTGLSGDTAHNYLYGATPWDSALYRLDPTTGDVLETLPIGDKKSITGAAVLGDEIFVSHSDNSATNNYIDVYDRNTGALNRVMPVPVTVALGGLGGDGVGTGDDWYQLALTNGPVALTTQTPSVNNILDPALELYNAGGTLVASDDNSVGDGRNARINYTAPSAGTYRLRVRSVNGMGAYVVTLGTGGGNPPLDPFATWQFLYFGCTNCARATGNADADGDGQSNTNEFLSGTNPTNSLSALRIISVAQQNNDVNITWRTVGGKTNALQATTGRDGYTNSFADITGLVIIPGSGDMMTNYWDVEATTNVPARFYRIRLVP